MMLKVLVLWSWSSFRSTIDEFVVRLQQLTEFDCMTKGFNYLAAHLPRDEFLEPVMDEVFEQIVHVAKNMMSLAADQKLDNFLSPDVDMDGLGAAMGRSSSNDTAVGVPLCEAEPDMFPCLVVCCGSAFAFLKVSTDRFGLCYFIEFQLLVILLEDTCVCVCVFVCVPNNPAAEPNCIKSKMKPVWSL